MAQMSEINHEVASQPAMWSVAQTRAGRLVTALPAAGARVAAVGCGTSYYMAQAYAAAREARGMGETDAFAASEMPLTRRYDHVLAISRSGATTELIRAL